MAKSPSNGTRKGKRKHPERPRWILRTCPFDPFKKGRSILVNQISKWWLKFVLKQCSGHTAPLRFQMHHQVLAKQWRTIEANCRPRDKRTNSGGQAIQQSYTQVALNTASATAPARDHLKRTLNRCQHEIHVPPIIDNKKNNVQMPPDTLRYN